MRKNILVTTMVVSVATVLIPGSSLAGFIKPKKPAGGSGGGGGSAPAAPAPIQGDKPNPNEKTASKGVGKDGQIIPGTYETVNIGTGGGHKTDPGSVGPMTILSTGALSGSLYNYSDDSTDTVSGNVNLSTGEGTVSVTNSRGGNTDRYTISIKTTTQRYSFLEGTYQKIGSSSKGEFWGLKQTP
jgi:hypothetical protein